MDDKNNRYENLVEKTFDEIGAFGKFQKSNMLLMLLIQHLAILLTKPAPIKFPTCVDAPKVNP